MGTKNKKETRGRKWFDISEEDKKNGKTEETIIAKIEEATAIDATVQEILYYADIGKDSYYRYLKAHPLFSERLARLREKPVLKARQEAIKGLNCYTNAIDYLSRKRKAEFSQRTDIDVTTKDESLHLTEMQRKRLAELELKRLDEAKPKEEKTIDDKKNE